MLTIVLCAAALGLAAYLARDPLATFAAGVVLDRQPNLSCSHPRLDVHSGLDTVLVSPVDCKVEAQPVTEFRTATPMRVELSGAKPRLIHVEKATMNQRERDISHVDMNTLGDLADFVGMTDSMVKGMLDGAEMYEPDMKRLVVDELAMRRGGKYDSTMIRFRQDMDGPWNHSQADRIETGGGPVTVANYEMRVTQSRARSRVDIYLGEREPGDKPDFKLALTGERLNTREPRIELKLL